MRYAAVCLVVVAAAVSACSPKTDAGAAADKVKETASKAVAVVAPPPKPRVGLWQSQMVMGGARPMTVSSQICMDEAFLSQDHWLSAKAAAGDCTQSNGPAPGGYAFESKCVRDGRTITTKGLASGDFNAAYKVDMTMHSEPAMVGGLADTQMSVTSTYLGPCAPGQAAGPVPGSAKVIPGAG